MTLAKKPPEPKTGKKKPPPARKSPPAKQRKKSPPAKPPGISSTQPKPNAEIPSASYNFLFGYAYLGLPAAIASVHPLADDKPPERVLAERLAKITLHELGHSFGLDHHDYVEEIDCLMIGDASVDCTETVDSGGIRFCKPCGAAIRKKLRRW